MEVFLVRSAVFDGFQRAPTAVSREEINYGRRSMIRCSRRSLGSDGRGQLVLPLEHLHGPRVPAVGENVRISKGFENYWAKLHYLFANSQISTDGGSGVAKMIE